MNVEAQTIGVPTGVQDYRPASTAAIAAIELRLKPVIRRVPVDVDAERARNGASSSPTPARRAIRAPTTGKSPSGTSTATRSSSCFERIRDTAVAMREALERGDWEDVAKASPTSGRPQTAGARRDDRGIDELFDRARDAGATAGKVCGAGGGGCPPSHRARSPVGRGGSAGPPRRQSAAVHVRHRRAPRRQELKPVRPRWIPSTRSRTLLQHNAHDDPARPRSRDRSAKVDPVGRRPPACGGLHGRASRDAKGMEAREVIRGAAARTARGWPASG